MSFELFMFLAIVFLLFLANSISGVALVAVVYYALRVGMKFYRQLLKKLDVEAGLGSTA